MSSNAKHLPSIDAGHYKNTAGCETEIMPVPEIVKISMSQHIGAPCQPLVKKGDTVKVGQLIGDVDAFVSAPIHATVSGTVKGIEKQRNMMRGEDTLVVIESDGKQELAEDIKVPEANDLKEFVAEVRKSGLVGLGGASFPTHIKYNPPNIDEVDTLIVNAAECEPFITSDHRAMLEDAQDIIDGMKLIMKHLDLKVGYIGIERNKPDAIALLDKMFKEQGLDNLHTFELLDRYPKGAERVLIYEITGQVMNAGVLPAQLGVILSNVTSVAFLGSYFRTGVPLVQRRLTVDGDAVVTPKNIIAPFGTQIHDIVEFCGGYKKDPSKIIMGGPMMGRSIISDEIPIVKNNNAILAFSEERAPVAEETACINCGRCHEACPFGLLPTALADAFEMKDGERLLELDVMQCMNCGSCSFVCPAHRPLGFINTLAKGLAKEAMNK